MQHLITFENWQESKILSDMNASTGVFDDEEICEVESGDSYGITDDIMSKYKIVQNGASIRVTKITGKMDDDFCDLTFYFSDGHFYDLKAYWDISPNPHNDKSKDYLKIYSYWDKKTYNIDPEWALEEILQTGYGSHFQFFKVCYPGCEIYYDDKIENVPEMKLVNPKP